MKKIANIVLNDFTNDSRVLKITKSLITFGYQPTVVAMHNYNLKLKESVAGIEVERVKLITRPWPKWRPVQFLKYLEFIFRAFWRYREVDIAHCNDLNALPVGLLIKLFGKNVKVVYDCHEYETEINSLKGAEKKVKKGLERFLIYFADQVITVSDSISNEYARLYKIPKPYLVLNCPAYKEQPKRDLFRENLGIRTDQTIFLYQGGLSKGRGLELLLEAFTGLESDQNVLVCMGYGPLEGMIKRKSSENNAIFFHSAVLPDVLLNYTGSANYGILFYEDTCLNHRYCSPNKIFEYLMAGLPLLTSNLHEMKRLVETEGVGIVAQENTVEGFREAVHASLNQDYKAIQKKVFEARKKYCWEDQEKVLKEIYDDL
jgi:glycosyltransferase involved in cell wall biosynthesis